MEGHRKPGIFEANLLFLIMGFGLIFIGYLVQSRNVFSGLLITEYALILLPNLLFLLLKRYSIKNVIKINKVSFKQIVYTVFIMIFSYPIAVFLNAVLLALINSISQALPTSVPIPTSSTELLRGFFIIAVSPGICEEFMFRGTMMSAYERFGYRKSIIITAILFGVFHFNIMNLMGPIFLGIVLGLLRHKTNSIIPSIIGHTVNNGVALSIGYLVTKYSGDIADVSEGSMVLGSGPQIIMTLIAMGLVSLFCLGIVVTLFKNIPEKDWTYEINEYSEISFNNEPPSILKYLPLIIVFTGFIIINTALLFFA